VATSSALFSAAGAVLILALAFTPVVTALVALSAASAEAH
jgi:hypothetical protein